MKNVKELKNGNGWVVYQEVSVKNGGWKWCNKRGFFRVVLTHHNPEVYKGNIVRPGDVVLFETSDCCFDYPGGDWGYEEKEDAAKEFFNKI